MKLTKEEKSFLIDKIKKSDVKDIIPLIRKYREYEITSDILGMVFEKLYVTDTGFSADIDIEDLVGIHPAFRTKNGSTWNRDYVSYLGRKYNLVRGHTGGKISSVRCDGPLKNPRAVKIRKDIWDKVTKKNCVILDIASNVECDHKDGLKDDWKVADPKMQVVDDFQPLCKTANMAKKDHCTKCKKTGKRYDAKRLGYSVSFLYGDENTKSCVGCYWYDPLKFNEVVSKEYKKKV
ncbi:MAG: hypothetical protein J6Y28_01465 [Acholeplasmatales bacterium]|nr:hypothetical protein [Acholeplasmatales bacterium]